ncbi:hypothetical protein F5141DRAFT_1067320, partial [Pisolithus sp. B1]
SSVMGHLALAALVHGLCMSLLFHLLDDELDNCHTCHHLKCLNPSLIGVKMGEAAATLDHQLACSGQKNAARMLEKVDMAWRAEHLDAVRDRNGLEHAAEDNPPKEQAADWDDRPEQGEGAAAEKTG